MSISEVGVTDGVIGSLIKLPDGILIVDFVNKIKRDR